MRLQWESLSNCIYSPNPACWKNLLRLIHHTRWKIHLSVNEFCKDFHSVGILLFVFQTMLWKTSKNACNCPSEWSIENGLLNTYGFSFGAPGNHKFFFTCSTKIGSSWSSVFKYSTEVCVLPNKEHYYYNALIYYLLLIYTYARVWSMSNAPSKLKHN